jgi:uncharacterized membrane protein
MPNLELGQKKSSLPQAAGIISLVAGSIGSLVGLVLLALAIGGGMSQGWYDSLMPLGIYLFFAAWLLISGAIAITGGRASIKQRNWPAAMSGAVASLFTGFTLPAIIAVVFVAISKKEFDK